jgi:hypothetical protein
MLKPSPISTHLPPFTLPRNSLEALERLRDSYKGLSARETLTEADQFVLMAVEITLKQFRRAQHRA